MRRIRFYPVKNFAQTRRMRRGIFLMVMIAFLLVGGWTLLPSPQKAEALLSKIELRERLKGSVSSDLFSFRKNEVLVPSLGEPVVLDYSFDPTLQALGQDLLDQYKPDLGVMVAMDASTGRILAMVGVNRSFEMDSNPALLATYPSASVFKVVTAAAAIEEQKARAHSMITFAGRDHTLYKYQVLKERVTGWIRQVSLKEAFAKSVNTVFGRLAVFELGKQPLKTFSTRFGYDEEIPSEFPIALSKAANPSDNFELAEMGSGYTQDNVMSPIHGAMIAAAVANDGVMMQPYFVNTAYLKSGKTIYRAEPSVQSKVMSPDTAGELKTLMRETVASGTSRRAFHGFFRGNLKEIDVGGKTGHLTDRNLKGRIDWFVGFAESQGRKVAVSVLTMHKKFWTVKSSYLARRAFETAFSEKKVASHSL